MTSQMLYNSQILYHYLYFSSKLELQLPYTKQYETYAYIYTYILNFLAPQPPQEVFLGLALQLSGPVNPIGPLPPWSHQAGAMAHDIKDMGST